MNRTKLLRFAVRVAAAAVLGLIGLAATAAPAVAATDTAASTVFTADDMSWG